jgi:NADH-quinone oxidoreductase subunit J
MDFELIFFVFVALVAVFSALIMITRSHPVQSVLFLIVNFFCLAVLYLLLHAQFIAIIQILVYAGAIMVLFLFVIMLLNLGDENRTWERMSVRKIVAYALAIMVLVEIIVGIGITSRSPLPPAAEIGTVESIGKALYSQYLFPFEVTSMLLLAAMVGVVVLAKKKNS